jgi:hypothetical protein
MDQRQQDRRTEARMALRLQRGGVSSRHVLRGLRELRDHRADLVKRLTADGSDQDTARCEANALLGDPDLLVEQMIARPELRSRARRFAWLLFVLGPLPMIAMLCVLAILAGSLLFEGADRLVDLPLEGTQTVALTRMLFLWAAPGAVGLLLCHAAVRHAVPAIWPICANAIVALTSSFSHVSGTTRVTGIHFGPWPDPALFRALVFFVLLGMAYLVLLRRAQFRRLEDA